MNWPFGRRRDRDRTARDEAVDARLAALDASVETSQQALQEQAPLVEAVSSRATRAADRRTLEIKRNHLDQLYIRDMRSQVSRGDTA